ncbi:hypothetical protein LguiB_033284 [Lonicera macranthoides]
MAPIRSGRRLTIHHSLSLTAVHAAPPSLHRRNPPQSARPTLAISAVHRSPTISPCRRSPPPSPFAVVSNDETNSPLARGKSHNGPEFKGGFMVDYDIGLGGAGLVLVQGGAKVDWFDPRPAGSAGAPSLTRVPAGTTMPGPTRVLTDTIIGIRAMVDPRTCEVVPVARLSGVERTRLSLSLHNTRGAAIKVVVQVLRFKGRFMVDYGIGLGGARPVLVQCGAEVDWFDPRWRLLRMVGSNH